MKKLKPSHREKKRYLLIKGEDSNKNTIDKAILEYIGILGYSKASPEVIKNDEKGLILAVNRKSLNEILAAFQMSGKKIEVIKISGSVKKLK
jgi:RNase P/RNase MRP subunit POP5